METKNLIPSKNPVEQLENAAYLGQPKENRQYLPGYEEYMSKLPQFIEQKDLYLANYVLINLAAKLQNDSWTNVELEPNEFKRTIIAVQDAEQAESKEGIELLVAQWGKGFKSPVHGHANGLLHEQLLKGKMLVNSYQIVENSPIPLVRPLKTQIFESRGEVINILSQFGSKESIHPRPNLIHNFVTLEPSTTLHYVAEHTRDGRDNGYAVEYFEENYDLSNKVKRITAQEGLYSQIGDVLIVRSTNVPEYGDHFVIVTGPPVMKEHGMRPQDISIQMNQKENILDNYSMETGVILLKLNEEARDAFFEFHNIELRKEVIMPEH